MSSKTTRINNQIRCPEVRVIDDQAKQLGVMRVQEAQRLARDQGKDLVEIQPNAHPPVCRIMDFGKFQYEQSKKRSLQKKSQKVTSVKEIKFRPTTDVGDYKVKSNKIIAFLTRGDKVKVTMRFRGREMMHRDLGVQLLARLKADLGEKAVVEQDAKLEGRQIMMVLSPGKLEVDKADDETAVAESSKETKEE